MSEIAFSRKPVFNHIAMSVPAELLREQGRKEILDFYGEVFGWTEMPTLSEEGKRLVLRAYSNEQFVFLIAGDEPMRCARMDHFGMSVGTLPELQQMLERAKKYRERDPRVDLIDHHVDDFEVMKLHNFYVRFLLPLMVEVQCFEWSEGTGPDSLPRS